MVKKVLTWLAIGFAVFYLMTQPVQAAGAVKGAGQGLQHAANQLVQFFSNLH